MVLYCWFTYCCERVFAQQGNQTTGHCSPPNTPNLSLERPLSYCIVHFDASAALPADDDDVAAVEVLPNAGGVTYVVPRRNNGPIISVDTSGGLDDLAAISPNAAAVDVVGEPDIVRGIFRVPGELLGERVDPRFVTACDAEHLSPLRDGRQPFGDRGRRRAAR